MEGRRWGVHIVELHTSNIYATFKAFSCDFNVGRSLIMFQLQIRFVCGWGTTNSISILFIVVALGFSKVVKWRKTIALGS